jgi:hypothetical protein
MAHARYMQDKLALPNRKGRIVMRTKADVNALQLFSEPAVVIE